MSEYFDKVKSYLQDLDLAVDDEDTAEALVVVSDEDRGINHLIVDCEDPAPLNACLIGSKSHSESSVKVVPNSWQQAMSSPTSVPKNAAQFGSHSRDHCTWRALAPVR